MKKDNIAIEIYNNAIKQCFYLNIDASKENIKKICENNIFFLKMQFPYINHEDKVILNFYDKVLSKILLL
jgi:hypothetical protein